MRKVFQFLVVATLLVFTGIKTFAHCEVPCGIYDDKLRIQLIEEHITTIEKAMYQIKDLQDAEDMNYNQLVRWINTKDEHAVKIQHIADQYFMTQRIKPAEQSDEEAYDKYISQLTLMHELLIYAMKAKQTLDQEWIDKMRETVDKFELAYFGKPIEEIEEHTH
jgi:nickel superoxide dismutase